MRGAAGADQGSGGRGTARKDVTSSAAGIARGAAIIAGLTVVSRLLGLVRTLVFSQVIGANCLGTAYVTASQVPNLIYELVLGGALTSAMIPVLARSAERAGYDPEEKDRVSQISSALLTWSIILLIPVTLVIAAAAGEIAGLFNPANANSSCSHADVVHVTGTMLEVFAPQVVLYGLSVVMFGVLQAYRRFVSPTLAPGVSSLVLIASYLAFAPLDKGLPLSRVPFTAELVLSGGATLGIATLVLVTVVPMWRLHLRLRPVLRFPPGVGRRVGGMAMVGFVEFLANDLNTVATIEMANGRGTTGALVLFNYAWQVFSAVFAVLAMSVVISAFPVLSARDGPEFDRTSAGSTRAVLLVSWLGTAVIAAIAIPTAHVLAKQPDQVAELIEGFVLFAPGIAGIAVISNLSRVMFVIGRLKIAAYAVGGSWLAATAAQVVLAEIVPARLVVAALALGFTIGQSVAAVPLVIVTRRICGPAAVEGFGHGMLAGLAAGAAGSAVGVAVSLAVSLGVPTSGKLAAAGLAVASAVLAIAAFLFAAYLLDRGDLKAIMARLRRLRARG
jgi:putative peptidoglycan lipid II flippase